MKAWQDENMAMPLAVGRFSQRQLFADYYPTAFDPGLEMLDAIEGEWDKKTEEAKETGKILFDGDLARLMSFQTKATNFFMSFQKTSYKAFVGTNLHDPSLPNEKRADPMGNSALIITADRRIVLGRRSEEVFGHPGWLHCIGGNIDPKLDVKGETVDTFGSIIREVREEINIDTADIQWTVCLGIVRDKETMKPEQLFYIRIKKRIGEVSLKGKEHTGLVTLDNNQLAINEFLKSRGERIVPVARAALRVYAEYEKPF
jgi:hypothetical protein